MAEKQFKEHGVPQPKGTSWLNEVRLDAARNIVRNLKEQAERQEYEEAKAHGLTVKEIVESGKEDLENRGFLDSHKEFVEETGFDYDEEQLTDDGADKNGRTNVRQADKKEAVKASDNTNSKEAK